MYNPSPSASSFTSGPPGPPPREAYAPPPRGASRSTNGDETGFPSSGSLASRPPRGASTGIPGAGVAPPPRGTSITSAGSSSSPSIQSPLPPLPNTPSPQNLTGGSSSPQLPPLPLSGNGGNNSGASFSPPSLSQLRSPQNSGFRSGAELPIPEKSPSLPPTPMTPGGTSTTLSGGGAGVKKPSANPLVDLMGTEKLYVGDLAKVIQNVASVYSSDPPPSLLDNHFHYLEALYNLNNSFLSNLNSIGANPKEPKELGDLLMRWVDKLEDGYRDWGDVWCGAGGWDEVKGVGDNPVLKQTLDKLSPLQESGLPATLEELFALPHQRLFYYQKLYHRLLRSTKEGRSDHKLLVGACDKLQTLVNEYEDAKSKEVYIPGGMIGEPDLDSELQSRASLDGEGMPYEDYYADAQDELLEELKGIDPAPPRVPSRDSSFSGASSQYPERASQLPPPLQQPASSPPSQPNLPVSNPPPRGASRNNIVSVSGEVVWAGASDTGSNYEPRNSTMPAASPGLAGESGGSSGDPSPRPKSDARSRGSASISGGSRSREGSIAWKEREQERFSSRSGVLSDTADNFGSRASTATSISNYGRSISAMRPEDVERRLDTTRTLDIFTMQPKKCTLHINPPDLAFPRTVRRTGDVVISFVPTSDPSGHRVIHSNAYIILLTDLFLVCEKMTDREKLEQQMERGLDGRGSTPELEEKDLWLVYPPLSGRHLKVDGSIGENVFEVTVLKKERLRVEVIGGGKREKNSWVGAFEDSIAFGNNSALRQNVPPRSPSLGPSQSPTSAGFPPSPGFYPPNRGRSMDGGPGDFPPPIPRQGSIPPNGMPGQGFMPRSHSPGAPGGPGMRHMSPPMPPGPYGLPPPPGQFGRPPVPGYPLSAPPTPGYGSPPERPPMPPMPPDWNQRQQPLHKSPSSQSLGAGSAGSSNYSGPRRSVSRPRQPHPNSPSDYEPSVYLGKDNRSSSRQSGMYQRSRSAEPPGKFQLPSEKLKQQRANSTPFDEPEPEEAQSNPQPQPTSTQICAQMRCKVFAQQGFQQWKAVGTAKLKLFVSNPGNIKQLVVETEKTTLISTIVLVDGVEKVGRTGVAIELSNNGRRTGIIYMLQMKSEASAKGLFEQLLLGSNRTG